MTVSGDYSFGVNVASGSVTLSKPNTIALMGGNVGINTTTPAYKLTVAGDMSVTGTLRVGNGADPGTLGYVLMSNGASLAPTWVATSSLVGVLGTMAYEPKTSYLTFAYASSSYPSLVYASSSYVLKPSAPATTSTLKLTPAGTTVARADATSSLWGFQYNTPTTSPTFKAWWRFNKDVCLNQFLSGIATSSAATLKLWTSTDYSGNAASTTIGTYNITNTTTGQIFYPTNCINAGSFIVAEMTAASGTQIGTIWGNIGGWYPNN
jgi:hypothetical protein